MASDVAGTIEALRADLASRGRYISDDKITAALFLARQMTKPLLIEGPPGSGKTELALAASRIFEMPLIRMQCYEGLDEAKALYEWKYGKQLLYTQILKDKLGELLGDADDARAAMSRLLSLEDVFFSEAFLEPRPLLRALRAEAGAVLLIDEIDKADEAFEAFLLELLSDDQITIPELGTVRAEVPPFVILTSNATRDLGGALRRRCLHLSLSFPDKERMERILNIHLPEVKGRLLREIVGFVEALREEDLRKIPSISETVDWARALLLLHADGLHAEMVEKTLTALLKIEQDVETVLPRLEKLLSPTNSGKDGEGES